MTKVKIIPYEKAYEAAWDDLVLSQSANGNVFHSRRFLGYHPEERFRDCSSLIFFDERLAGVFPACRDSDSVISHKGSSAGGPVIHRKFFRYSVITEIVARLGDFYGDAKMTIKLPESIFFSEGSDILLYEYKRIGFDVLPELGSYKRLEGDLISTISKDTNRNIIKRTLKSSLEFGVAELEEEYKAFYSILSGNLARHNVSPTHSLEEMLVLRQLLDDKQVLMIATDESKKILAGVWIIKATSRCWHSQYIARDYSSTVVGITETTLFKCFELAQSSGALFFNLGISTEDRGRVANQSLLTFKEGLGTTHVNRYFLERK